MIKKNNITKYIIASITMVCIASIISSCASSPNKIQKIDPLPSKYLNPSEQYPNNQFVAAVGVGDTLKDAQQSALNALAQQIKVQVQSTQSLSETNTETENSSDENSYESTTSLTENINISTHQEFIGVQYGDSYIFQSQIYIIAYLDRIKVGNLYRQKIDARNKEITLLMEEVDRAKGLSRYSKLSTMYTISLINDAQIEQLEVIAPTYALAVKPISHNTTIKIAERLQKTAKAIVIITETVVRGTNGNTRTIIEDDIISLFTSLHFSVNGNTATPILANTTITFQEQTTGKYPTVIWNLTMKLIENGNTIATSTKKSQAKAKDLTQARELAIHDIKNTIHIPIKRDLLQQIK